MHFIVHFEARDGCAGALRAALLEVARATSAEPGCVSFRVFESTQAPWTFAIHSEWKSDDAFDLHASLPHTQHFLATSARLLTHEIRGRRLRPLAADVALGT